MALITRWSYERGGRKAGFHCTLIIPLNKPLIYNSGFVLTVNLLPFVITQCFLTKIGKSVRIKGALRKKNATEHI